MNSYYYKNIELFNGLLKKWYLNKSISSKFGELHRMQRANESSKNSPRVIQDMNRRLRLLRTNGSHVGINLVDPISTYE